MRKLGTLVLPLAAGLWVAAVAAPASAHPVEDAATRTAVVSAFPPEMAGD